MLFLILSCPKARGSHLENQCIESNHLKWAPLIIYYNRHWETLLVGWLQSFVIGQWIDLRDCVAFGHLEWCPWSSAGKILASHLMVFPADFIIIQS